MATPTSSAPTSTIALTGNTAIDALLGPQKWIGPTITYSIPTATSYWSQSITEGYGPSSSKSEPWSGYLDFLRPAEAARFRDALAAWSHVANLQFVETTDNSSLVGDIRIAYSWTQGTADSEAWAYMPDGSAIGGDIWINTDSLSYHSTYSAGSYGFMTMLHELGHALGFKHPFEAEPSNSTVLDAARDTISSTLMSYFFLPGISNAYLSYYPTTPMVYDIQAMQSVYGKNMAYNAGDTVYSYANSNSYLETIWDGGGNNTISYSGSRAATIDLREGHGSMLGNEVTVSDLSGNRLGTIPNVWIAYGTAIRNAIGGSGNNTLIGNDLDNILTGGPAGNTISGGAGNDTIILSGTGTIDGGSGLDTLQLSGLRSNYTFAKTSTGFTISANGTGQVVDTLAGIERVLFSDSAVALDVDGHGGAAYRVYQAAFARRPDIGGLGYWIEKLDHGYTTIDLATGFFNSPEFKGIYGDTPNNSDLVNRLYQNVLHRAPEEAGYNYWMTALDSGQRSQPTALAQFSESPENQAQLIGVMQNGMDYIVA